MVRLAELMPLKAFLRARSLDVAESLESDLGNGLSKSLEAFVLPITQETDKQWATFTKNSHDFIKQYSKVKHTNEKKQNFSNN